jgi:hypothetical protein
VGLRTVTRLTVGPRITLAVTSTRGMPFANCSSG